MNDEQKALRRRLWELEKVEREERSILLAPHNEKWRRIRQDIKQQCEALGGHEWVAAPDNGFNAPHFMTGEWPMYCRHCRSSKPVDFSHLNEDSDE